MALHLSVLCFSNTVAAGPHNGVRFFSQRTVKASRFSCQPLAPISRVNLKGTLFSFFGRTFFFLFIVTKD